MSANGFERYLLLERSGHNKSNTSVFEMRLNGKKVHIRHGNKGQKLQKNVLKKKSISEAIALFSDKRKQKITDGYRIMREENKNNPNNINLNHINNNLQDALPLSGKSLIHKNTNSTNNNHPNAKSFSFSFGQKQKQNSNIAHHSHSHSQQQQNQNQQLAKIRQQLQQLNITNSHQQQQQHSDDDEEEPNSARSGRLKRGNPAHQNRPRKVKQNRANKQKNRNKNKNRNRNKKNKKKNPKQHQNRNKQQQQHQHQQIRQQRQKDRTSSSDASSSSAVSHDSYQENNSQYSNSNGHHNNNNGVRKAQKMANGHHNKNLQYSEDEEVDEEEVEMEMEMEYEETPQSPTSSTQQTVGSSAEEEEDEEDEDEVGSDEEEEEEEEEESASSTKSKSSSHSASVQSGRSSDDEYEMDYEKMSHVMHDALNKDISDFIDDLEWKPIKLWIRSNEYNDKNGEYAFAPQIKRIAGSCHELLVVYLRSNSIESQRGIIYKRLLKLARDPEEDNKHHFENERRVSQYLTEIARVVNHSFTSRTDVCIWPVESILFEYNGKLKWATIQAPFLPAKCTNNIFVKIEPNSGKPCVNDAVVGRYQHIFAAMTRGLDLIRDWQGYGVSQEVFLNVCNQFDINDDVLSQIKIRKNVRIRKQTQVLIVIDPVLTTYNAHYETNNPTDFGVKAIDEWKYNHDCVRCRCKYFHLLSTNITDENKEGMLFGIADIDQHFFNINTIPKKIYQKIQILRKKLNIWCGDEDDDEEEEDEDDNKNDQNDTIINGGEHITTTHDDE